MTKPTTIAINDLDGWIEQLYNCTPIAEESIVQLVEQVFRILRF